MDHQQKPPQAKRVKKNPLAPAVPEEVLSPPPYDAEAIDPERRDKIEKIKKALDDGTYRIDNDQVARKLIENMREPKR